MNKGGTAIIRPLLTMSAEGFFDISGAFYEVVNIRLAENCFLNGFYACVIE